jgi:two-component system sensor histidine kinase RegB
VADHRRGAQLADALAATELVLAREQHLSQLDGLAAAAAHELGTPLSTIFGDRKELERAIEPDSPHADDVRLLREQAQRCRDILAKLTELPPSGEPFDRMPLSALIEEVVAPHRNFGVAINVRCRPPARRAGRRAQSGDPLRLGNLWRTRSISRASASRSPRTGATRTSIVTISDDGPGFAPEIMDRIGEPYVHQQAARMNAGERKRARPRLLHRQDAAGALRRHVSISPTAAFPTAAPWSIGALGAQRFRSGRQFGAT